MIKTIALATTSLLLLISPVIGEEMYPIASRDKQLADAYTFVARQKATIELIKSSFPELAREAQEAQDAFEASSLGEGGGKAEADLAKIKGANWTEIQQGIASQAKAAAAREPLTLKLATDFVKEVNSRVKGNLPGAIRTTLLASNPRFVQAPEKELEEGWTQAVHTKGNPRAKGLDLTLTVPASWVRRTPNHPGIIDLFQSGAGHGAILCMIMAMEIPAADRPTLQTEEQKRALLQPEALKVMVPAGSKLVEAKSMTLEKLPAGMFIHDTTRERLDQTAKNRTTVFVVVHNDKLVTVQFVVMDYPGSTASYMEFVHKSYAPVHRAVANTLSLNDIWHEEPDATTPDPTKSDASAPQE